MVIIPKNGKQRDKINFLKADQTFIMAFAKDEGKERGVSSEAKNDGARKIICSQKNNRKSIQIYRRICKNDM